MADIPSFSTNVTASALNSAVCCLVFVLPLGPPVAPMGCSATAAEVGPASSDTTWATPPQIAGPEADPPSVDEMLRHVESLGPRQRAVLSEAMGTLSVNCPYTRASLQLPLALHAVVSRIEASHIDRDERDAWRELQRGLEVHVALLDTIGVDLRSPKPGAERWHDALRRLAPFVMDDKTRGQIHGALDALDAHDKHGC